MSNHDKPLCLACAGPGLERTRFYARQLVTADDLTQDQDYFRARMRRHNRLLHGWGVVCGVRCRSGPKPGEVTVEPGFVLSPQGDEIAIEREVTLDLATQDLDGNAAGSTGTAADPWCSAVRLDRHPGDKLYLAVRYMEVPTQPVRAPAAGCGCDTEACEYSRLADGYALRLLSRLPAGYADPLPAADPSTAWSDTGSTPGCLPCPTEPWVVLADITVGNPGEPAKVDCYAHRRHVVSFANAYYTVGAQGGAPRVASLRLEFDDGSELLTPPTPLETRVAISPEPLLPVPAMPTALEVSFSGGSVDPGTVNKDTLRVDVLTPTGNVVPIAATVTPVADGRTFRWVPQAAAVPAGTRLLQLTLPGSANAPAVTSTTGTLLDGEVAATGLPSGDGTPGGDFKLLITDLP